MSVPAPLAPEVSLREVRPGDLPIFFAHQRDPEATRMAAFSSRAHDAFMAHWSKIMAEPANALRTILCEGKVVGHIGAWTDGSDRLVGYWIGRDDWGRGIASAALAHFLRHEPTRPLIAHVAKHNVASIRVLLKAGFQLASPEAAHPSGDAAGGEFVFRL